MHSTQRRANGAAPPPAEDLLGMLAGALGQQVTHPAPRAPATPAPAPAANVTTYDGTGLPGYDSDPEDNTPQVAAPLLELLRDQLLQNQNAEGRRPPEGPRDASLPTFDGKDKDKFEAWWLALKGARTTYNWDEQTTLTKIVSLMRDDALIWWYSKPANERDTYRKAKDLLYTRYVPQDDYMNRRAELGALEQKPDEDYYTLAQRAEQITQRAYPSLPNAEKEKMTIQKYVWSFTDKAISAQVWQQKPRTMADAVSCAIHTLTGRALLKSQKSVRAVTVGGTVSIPTTPTRPPTTTRPATPTGQTPGSSAYTGCFTCKSPDHRSRDCREARPTGRSPGRAYPPGGRYNSQSPGRAYD